MRSASMCGWRNRNGQSHAEAVSEIDINPLLLKAQGEGAVALDALLIPRADGERQERH